LVQVDKDSKVVQFLEKPKPDEINRLNINTINAGIYIFEPQVLDLIPTDTNYSFEYQLFPDLLNRKELFHAFVADDNYWLDIGTPPRYLQAHHDLLAGKIKNFRLNRNNQFQIADSAEIDEISCIAKGCVIKSGAKIVNSILGKDVSIEKNAIIKNSVIWSGTKIGAEANIVNAIIGSDCQIGKNVFVTDGSVLGDATVIADFSRC
jgi:mannose-1-phosphate guanylyltransferase